MNLLRAACLTSLALAVTACQTAPPPRAVVPAAVAAPRILFVGNSFTYYNGGLDHHFQELARSAAPARAVTAERVTKGGATLRILQQLPAVHEKIQTGKYTVVVLQEDIPELKEHSVTPFAEEARRFDREIRATGAQPVLFMAWPYERLNWVDAAQIADAHRAIGRELRLPVAPVGAALARALAERPELAMLGKDREHETLHGTYLAACVFYAVLFGATPAGLPDHPPGVSAEEAAFLQKVAWRTVSAWAAKE